MPHKGLQAIPYRRRGLLWHPIIQFGVESHEHVITAEAYVDSGAYYSIFASSVADELGVEVKSGRKRLLRGVDGGLIAAWTHRLRVHIGPHHFFAEIGFSDHIGVGFNLLGRKDVFSRLSFTFNDKHHLLFINDADVLPISPPPPR
ncbi:MAG: hypothetical protein HY318_11700 [Armatimonadetes bacterium]|nr:hypothetical protein [Armatimonadota bacterium]